jgi:alkanesulfonate monooxygenase SsuD/methylene tetrahydromethanopterin reductase-like flavin-dependent oxidoreductase (luciferase family)
VATDDLRFGLVLPTRDFLIRGDPTGYRATFEMAERAEALGYDSVWMGDSLLSKPRLEVFSTLGYIAGRTRRLGLGTSIYIPTLREPVQLAYSIASLDLISEGRVTFGIGMGGNDPASAHEYRTVGVDPERRVSRLEESLALLRRLWTEENVSFEGQHFHLENVTVLPRPAQPRGPRRLHSAGNEGKVSPRQARRVVELGDGIFPSRSRPAEFRQAWEVVRTEAERRGRDPATLERALYWTVHLDPDRRKAIEAAEAFHLGYYGRLGRWVPEDGPWGPADLIRRQLEAYVEAGVRLFVVRFAAWDALSQLDRFNEQVWRHYR